MTRSAQDIPDALLVEAADWHLRLQEAPDDAALRVAFEAWRAAGPSHAKAARLAERAWSLPVLAASRAPRRRPNKVGRKAAAAAAMALAASFLFAIMVPALGVRWAADHLTAVGETQSLALSDGSAITLGADSALAVDFSDARRHVRLLQGQAYFEVASNPARPFVVRAGEVDVTVTGTAFDVTLAADVVSVAVAEGQVSVQALGRNQDLRPGQRLMIDVATDHAAVTAVAPENVAAWRDGWLYVADASLDQVVAALGRHHAGMIVLRGDALKGRRVTGAYDLRDARRALRAIAASHGVTLREISPYLIVLTAS